MKKLTLLTTVLFLTLFSVKIQSQKFSALDKSPMDLASYPAIHDDHNTQIKVIYSRPQLKGRVLDSLVPSGKIWRTGANEATAITFYKDIKFGKKPIKAGTYSLVTIPGKKEWVIILNTDVNVWGAFSYKKENDVARLTIPVSKGEEALEAFSIAFAPSEKGVNMILGWGTLRVAVPFMN